MLGNNIALGVEELVSFYNVNCAEVLKPLDFCLVLSFNSKTGFSHLTGMWEFYIWWVRVVWTSLSVDF